MFLFRLLNERIHFRALAIALLAGKVHSLHCDGGYPCPTSKEGCCFDDTVNFSNYLDQFVGTWSHWILWCILFVLLLSCLGGCGIWRRRQLCPGRWCCSDIRNEEERSEPDSAGSCYPPPHYSRCSSFHHAPPPYTEVTSKPDLYPLVISYGSENGKAGDNYLMVQYFRNYIVRPTIGSLSAESTADSISSSFLCQSTTENDSNIPPPYEEPRLEGPEDVEMDSMSRSASCISDSSAPPIAPQPPQSRRASCVPSGVNVDRSPSEIHQVVAESIHQSIQNASAVPRSNRVQSALPITFHSFRKYPNSIRSFPNHLYTEPTVEQQPDGRSSNIHLSTFKRANRPVILSTSVDSIHERNEFSPHQYTSDVILAQPQSYCESNSELHYYSTDIISNPNRLLKYINDSFSSEDNLSQPRGSIQDFVSSDGLSHSHPSNLEMNHYSTSSDVSSLQGCGTPDSPPQATSPTGEFRDLLDKIQRLPSHRYSNRSLDLDSYSSFTNDPSKKAPQYSLNDYEGNSSASVPDESEMNTETNEESFLLTDSVRSTADKPKSVVRPNKLIFKRNFPSRSKTFYMPFCQTSVDKKKKNTVSFSAPVTPVSGFTSPGSIAVNFLANTRILGSKRSLENAAGDSSPLLQEESGNNDEIF